MSQNSLIMPSSPLTGAGLASAINNSLDSLATDFSGTSEPTTKWALMKWADTANNILKIRNLTNTAWISFMDLTTGNLLTNAATATTAGACTGNAATATLANAASGAIRFQVSGCLGSSLTIPASTATTIQEIYFSRSETEIVKLIGVRYNFGGASEVYFRIGADSYWQASGSNYDSNTNINMTIGSAGTLDTFLYVAAYNPGLSSVTLSREAGWWAELSME